MERFYAWSLLVSNKLLGGTGPDGEPNQYYQRYNQQLRHPKWTHVALLTSGLMERFYAWSETLSNNRFVKIFT